jgi:hypothetical protein
MPFWASGVPDSAGPRVGSNRDMQEHAQVATLTPSLVKGLLGPLHPWVQTMFSPVSGKDVTYKT